MAITYVGGNSNSAQNAGSVTVSLTALTGGSDSSPTAGDLILVAWSCGDDDFTQPTLAMTTSGYTELTTSTLSVDGGAGGDGNLAVFYKFHVSDTSVVTAASGTGTDSSNAVAVMVFRGVASVAEGGPLEITIQTATGASGGDPDPPQVSTFDEANSLVVIAGATSDTGGVTPTLTAPANYTTDAVLVANATEATIRAAAGLAYRTGTPSDPENPGAFTSGGDAWAAATMVLKMAPVTVTGVVLTATPSLPAATLDHGITGVVLDLVPTLPAAALTHTLTGIALSVTVTLPVAAVEAEGAGTGTGFDEVGRFWTSTTSETGEYPAASDLVSESGVYLFIEAAAGGQTVTGVALEVTPTLPAGSLQHSLTGVALSATPSLPAATLNHSLTGVVLSATPTLPAGSLGHSLTGVALSATPTLPAGSLRHSLTGVVLTITPTLPAGTISVGVNVVGVTLDVTPSLPAGSLTHTLTGVALSITPTLPAGTITVAGPTVTGVALSATPTLPAGSVNHRLTGVALSATPTLPAGTLGHSLTGVVLQITPTLPVATLNHSVLGVVLEVTISLPAGTVTLAGAGEPVKGPTYADELAGSVTADELEGPNRIPALVGSPNDAEALAGAPRAGVIGAGQNTTEEL